MSRSRAFQAELLLEDEPPIRTRIREETSVWIKAVNEMVRARLIVQGALHMAAKALNMSDFEAREFGQSMEFARGDICAGPLTPLWRQ